MVSDAPGSAARIDDGDDDDADVDGDSGARSIQTKESHTNIRSGVAGWGSLRTGRNCIWPASQPACLPAPYSCVHLPPQVLCVQSQKGEAADIDSIYARSPARADLSYVRYAPEIDVRDVHESKTLAKI